MIEIKNGIAIKLAKTLILIIINTKRNENHLIRGTVPTIAIILQYINEMYQVNMHPPYIYIVIYIKCTLIKTNRKLDLGSGWVEVICFSLLLVSNALRMESS